MDPENWYGVCACKIFLQQLHGIFFFFLKDVMVLKLYLKYSKGSRKLSVNWAKRSYVNSPSG